MASFGGRRWTAVLLLVSLLLIPISPLLSASSGGGADACACCRRKDHRNCGMSHSMPVDGPAWDATPKCGLGCRLLPALLTSFLFLRPEAAGLARLQPGTSKHDLKFSSHRAQTARFAWRYQRPPPCS
jgi:hypothetical protein